MTEKKTSIFANGLIWFGAAVSIAEILTGTFIAPLGFTKGFYAILLGHLIGCSFLFMAGLIGAKTEKSAMETVKMTFGQKGSLLFSSLNVLQLLGWTAVMIVSGAAAANAVTRFGGDWVWSLIIGGFIIIWILIGVRNLGKLNIVAMSALFILMVLLSKSAFALGGGFQSGSGISFGAAVELAVAMPLSWLPLISDYTRTAKKPVAATAVSVLVYFAVSSWMYLIGMGAAIFTGESDVTAILLKAGLGVGALIIVVFSTVTTTFLDTYSAGVSAVSMNSKIKEKPAALIICIAGTFLATLTPITQFENFLYLIGSVFAPMIAIMIVDYFFFRKDRSQENVVWSNLIIWLIGFVIYRLVLSFDTPVGISLPVMAVTALLAIVKNIITGDKRKC